MSQMAFSDFMSIFNMMRTDREEWMRAAAAAAAAANLQQKQSSSSLSSSPGPTTATAASSSSQTSSSVPSSSSSLFVHPLRIPAEEDDENIELQADLLFTASAEVPEEPAVQQAETDGESKADNCAAEGKFCQNEDRSFCPPLVNSLKSYSPERTAAMRHRARVELGAQPRLLSSTWLIRQRSLKAGIAVLRFFADDQLNSLLIQVLERKDCLDSPTIAVRAVARIFWSEEEMVNKHLRRSYQQQSHHHHHQRRSSTPTSGVVGTENLSPTAPHHEPHHHQSELAYSNDVHDLFMILHGMQDAKEWTDSGRNVWLHNTLCNFKATLVKQSQEAILRSKKRLSRSNSSSDGYGHVNGLNNSGESGPYSERKKSRPDDLNCGSSSDGIAD